MALTLKMFGFTLVQFLVILPLALGFNLDIRIPVIKNAPQAGSLFGYSIAEHQILNVDDGLVTENLFIVGAPKADVRVNRIANGNVRVPTDVIGFGSLYTCRLTANPDDCVRLQLGEEEYYDTNKIKENVTDQWLGVVVTSQGPKNKLLTCAHRYKKHRDSTQRTNWGFGKCYTFTNTLDYDDSWDACSQLSVYGGHEDYGYCQAGTSSTISEDGNIVIGAPGAKTWTGLLFKAPDTDAVVGLGWKSTPVEEGEDPPVPPFSYLGFSVTTGRFSNGEMFYAAGAPRAGDTGQVILFTALPTGEFKYIQENIIKGPGFGSMFGYDVLAVDINNDNYDDLIVGAPFYYVHKKSVGGAIYIYMGGPTGIDQTTVPTVILSRAMGEKECKRLQCTFARFGFSIASAGDLNKDGFTDIAVGAPYEGNGTVYIFHGSQKGIVKEYTQRISAENITEANLQAFGSSLSGGKDLDNNGYPDLAVGAFESEHAIILRSRPIIDIHPTVSVNPTQINPTGEATCSYDSTKKRCIRMTVCLQFSTDFPSSGRFSTSMRVVYKIEVDKFIGAVKSRVDFKSPTDPQTPYFIEKEMTVDRSTPAPGDCQSEIIYLKDVFRDKLRPIKFRVTYSLPERSTPPLTAFSRLPDINNFPILKPGPVNDLQVDLIKECGTDNICNSDLDLNVLILLTQDTLERQLPVLSVGSKKDMSIRVSIKNTQEPAYETNFFIRIPENVKFGGMDDPENTPVTCASYNDTIIQCPNIGNPFEQDGSITYTMRFNTDKVETTDGNFVIFAFVNTTSDEVNTLNNFYTQEVKVTARMDMYVTGSALPEQVIYSGSVRGETDIEFEDEIGPAVTHNYLVVNNGPSGVPRSTLYIMWPYEMHSRYNSGKHLLYLMEVPTATKGTAKDTVTCTVDTSIVNPIGAKIRLDTGPTYVTLDSITLPNKTRPDAPVAVVEPPKEETRNKRNAEDPSAVKKREAGDEKSKKIVTLDCERDTAKCKRIKCDIGPLGREEDVVITIRARLWESSFLQDYRNVDEVRVRSKAEISIDPKLNIEQATRDNDKAYAQTVAIPDVQIAEPVGELKWWIIVVAVIGGIILLGLLILLLWKLGFFKRKKHDQMEMHEAHLEKQKNPDDA